MAKPPLVPEWPTGSQPGDFAFLTVTSYPKGKRKKTQHFVAEVAADNTLTWQRTGSGPLLRFGSDGHGEMYVKPARKRGKRK